MNISFVNDVDDIFFWGGRWRQNSIYLALAVVLYGISGSISPEATLVLVVLTDSSERVYKTRIFVNRGVILTHHL